MVRTVFNESVDITFLTLKLNFHKMSYANLHKKTVHLLRLAVYNYDKIIRLYE
jgi:hypothetical protein